MEKQGKKYKVFERILLDHFLKKRRTDLINILSGESPCFYIDGYELLDLSDIVFTNLMIDPDKWFPKLDRLVAIALDSVLEESSQSEVIIINFSNHNLFSANPHNLLTHQNSLFIYMN